VNSLDIRHILRAPFAEQITYNDETIWAIVKRKELSNFTIQKVSQVNYSYPITIIVSEYQTIDEVESPFIINANKSTGDQVTLKNLKGITVNLVVGEIVSYDEVGHCYELRLV
jgi:hypothetical protein